MNVCVCARVNADQDDVIVNRNCAQLRRNVRSTGTAGGGVSCADIVAAVERVGWVLCAVVRWICPELCG